MYLVELRRSEEFEATYRGTYEQALLQSSWRELNLLDFTHIFGAIESGFQCPTPAAYLLHGFTDWILRNLTVHQRWSGVEKNRFIDGKCTFFKLNSSTHGMLWCCLTNTCMYSEPGNQAGRWVLNHLKVQWRFQMKEIIDSHWSIIKVLQIASMSRLLVCPSKCLPTGKQITSLGKVVS